MKSAKSFLAFLPGLLGALVSFSPLPAEAGDAVWTSLGPAGASEITGVALDPTDARIIYAVSDTSEQGGTGIRKSFDGGETWTQLGSGDPALSGLTCVAVDPSNPSNVYVGTAQAVVAASHDAGATWTKATVGADPSSARAVSSIAVEPATGSVYAAMRQTPDFCFGPTTHVSRSTDGGTTWSLTNLGSRRGVYALLADAQNQTLFAGINFAWDEDFNGFGCDLGEGGGVARTPDAGATWALPATDLGFAVTALAADPLGGAVFAATESGQIFRSGDAGASWTPQGKLAGTVATIAVDPSAPSTLYAGLSHGGVWRSDDGAATWRLFDSGLISGSVSSLAIDPTGRNLYAGTRLGVFHRELPADTAGPCQPGDDHLCLLGSRFRVDLHTVDPRTQAPAPVKALAQGDRFGYFSFPSLTGDPSLPEVFVKMLDATSLPGQGYWLFSSALTNVPYSLVVTDTTNGRIQFYDGQAFCGTADTQAFSPDAPSSAPAHGMRTSSTLEAPGGELALLSGRFLITLAAADPHTGATVPGTPIPQGDRFGYFSLPNLTGDSTFPEVLVKMLDARSLPNGDFWLFQGRLTTLPYTLTVTDSFTGAVKMYRNDPVDPTRLCGAADTRVTAAAETPLVLAGRWAGTGAGSAMTASVTQSGDRVEIRGVTTFPHQFHFVGVLRLGVLEGVLRAEYRTCHSEGAASGTATSLRIQLTSEQSGTCGRWAGGEIMSLTRNP